MTLWDFQRVMRQALGYALEELRRRLPCTATATLTIERMIAIRNTVAAELKGKVTNLEEIRLHAFQRTLEDLGERDDHLAAHLNALYLKHRFEDIELYRDVLPILNILKPHYRLGLISNGNSYPERCGLQDYFAFVVFSQDVGIEKPDPAIFHVACRKAGCTPNELLHVGDSLENDVEAARRAGATAVWLNRRQENNDSTCLPDFTINTLAELEQIISHQR
jgi:putative hydrolase of the HAD superfamily